MVFFPHPVPKEDKATATTPAFWDQSEIKDGLQSFQVGLWVFEVLVAPCFQSSLGGRELDIFFLFYNSLCLRVKLHERENQSPENIG